jgi:cellulose synthase/poly-beta-1,6-N-acetylglucosamine synthase-like glycosyltransferase
MKNKKKVLPRVSICTPTYNRRPFIPYLKKCILKQDYPLSRIEWVIVDDDKRFIQRLKLQFFIFLGI